MLASLKRETKETCIDASLEVLGRGQCQASTGIELLDEVLLAFAEGGGFDLAVKAAGDYQTGDHHTAEDVGIALGTAIGQLGIAGTGSSMVPSADGFAMAAVRFGQPGYTGDFELRSQASCGMALENVGHFMRALAFNGRFTLYLSAKGELDRPKIDAMALSLGRAIKKAAMDEVAEKETE
ncbi:MAG TPA: imidazoleglycerol-phosphate dehydratase [Methanotrichaceae archaeon]|nr:imidazoleglycerol-phosphate dehydratase [Methanotrichaceae archaeon]